MAFISSSLKIWSQNFAEMCEIDFYEKLPNFKH